MKTKTPYPYTLDRKADALRLTISPNNKSQLLFLACGLFFFVLFVVHIGAISFIFPLVDVKLMFIIVNSIVLLLEILVILYFILSYWWKRNGIEIFVLYPDKMEHTVVNKPLKTERHIFDFNDLEIRYYLKERYNNQLVDRNFVEEEEEEEDDEDDTEEEEVTEFDLDNVDGNFPIQFYMDNGKKVCNSDRKIPIETIRLIRNEYKQISVKIENA